MPPIEAEDPTLRLDRRATFNPIGQGLIVGNWTDEGSVTTSPAVTPTNDGFGVQGHAERPGLAWRTSNAGRAIRKVRTKRVALDRRSRFSGPPFARGQSDNRYITDGHYARWSISVEK